MPVSPVAAGAGRERSSSLDKRIATSRVPESDLVAGEVDFICNVVPLISLELDLPLALTSHHPLQVGVRGTGLAIDPAILQLCEMALKEANLMLVGSAGNVCGAALDREVVVHSALVDGSLGLGNELSAPHVLRVDQYRYLISRANLAHRVPLGCVVDRDLSTLLRPSVCRILERSSEVDVLADRSRTVDVVLVVADLSRLACLE